MCFNVTQCLKQHFLKNQIWRNFGQRESHSSICPQGGGVHTWVCQAQRLQWGRGPKAELCVPEINIMCYVHYISIFKIF